MFNTSVCTASADWSDKYLRAVFCTSEPSKNPELEALAHTNPVVIRYTGNNLRYIKKQTLRLIQLAIEYQLAAYEDFVLVVQRGAKICHLLLDLLYEQDLKVKYFSGLGGSLIMAVVSQKHEKAAMIPLSLVYGLVEIGLKEVVQVCFSAAVSLALHSMESICADIYHNDADDDRNLTKAKRVIESNNRDGPCVKLPGFSAEPTYVTLLRRIQEVNGVPTLLVETAMSDSTVKMEVDSLCILLGTKFQVDIMLATDLHADKNRRLESLDIVIFDATIESLHAILRVELQKGDQHRQAMAAFVLERKVLQKLCDVNSLLQILSWDGTDENFNTIIEGIKVEYRRHKPLLTLKCEQKPEYEPTKEDFEECLHLYGDFRGKLLEKQSEYQTIASQCSSVSEPYRDKMEMEIEEFQKDAESFIAKSLYYSRRIVKGITRKSEVEVKVPSIALTGVPMSENDYISLSPKYLNSLFGNISKTSGGSMDEVREVELSVPQNDIRRGKFKEVAAMNGCKNLKELYKGSSGTKKIKVRLLQLTDRFIRQSLEDWGVPSRGARPTLLSRFIEEYDRRNQPDPEPSAGHIDREGRKRSPDSKSPESKEGASKTNKSSTRRKNQRSSEVLPSDSGTQSSTGHAESQSELLVGSAVEGPSEQRIPSSVSDILRNAPEDDKE